MSVSGVAAVWNHSFNTAMDFLRHNDLDALEVYDIIRMMWVNSMICDSDAHFMLKELLDYHVDCEIVPLAQILALFELLGGE